MDEFDPARASCWKMAGTVLAAAIFCAALLHWVTYGLQVHLNPKPLDHEMWPGLQFIFCSFLGAIFWRCGGGDLVVGISDGHKNTVHGRCTDGHIRWAMLYVVRARGPERPGGSQLYA
jgi:hypothetical protein